MEQLGDRIRRLRLQKNISQRQFAKLVGASPGLISFIERNRNKPNYLIIGRIAKVLGTTSDYLIYGSEASGESTEELIKRLKRELGTDSADKEGLKLSAKERELIEKHNILARLARLTRTDLEIVLDVLKRIEYL
ncbi:MAG TPA: XRE family transcriptional regulator [candidate division Zixibacteria bacterium]|nr:XRE family transcriptional regulator [candidate division Zixibacteria bacterium]